MDFFDVCEVCFLCKTNKIEIDKTPLRAVGREQSGKEICCTKSHPSKMVLCTCLLVREL